MSTDPELIDEAVPLTEYAWQFRYPGNLVEPPVVEAKKALVTARKILREILKRLPGKIRP